MNEIKRYRIVSNLPVWNSRGEYCLWHEVEDTIQAYEGMKEGASIRIADLEKEIERLREIVCDWKSHFLRDDSTIREDVLEPTEAYSLFRREPYERVQVFAGPREWAIKQAAEVVCRAEAAREGGGGA